MDTTPNTNHNKTNITNIQNHLRVLYIIKIQQMAKQYKKKSNFNSKVKKVIRKMNETKCYFTPFTITASTSTNGGKADLVQISQGAGNDGRIGSSIQLRHLKISAAINSTGGNLTSPVRVLLIYSPSEGASNITLQDYLSGTYDPKRYFPIMDKYFTKRTLYDGSNLEQQGPIIINISKKIRYYQKYTGAAGTTLTRGHLVMMVNQENSVLAAHTMTGRVEVWYDDI